MTTLASIAALIAALNVKSDYQFVDVSEIGVTGDKQAEVGECVRGEHIARFYEWLAESKWIMQTCGATIPDALSGWDPPKPHVIDSDKVRGAVDTYNAVVTSDATSPVRWVYGDAHDSSLLCYSKSLTNVGYSDETVETIAQKSWEAFGRAGYTSWLLPASVALPNVTNDAPLTAAVVNDLNVRNRYSTGLASWTSMGANRVWTWRDNGYAESSYTKQGAFWMEGSPYNYGPNYAPKVHGENEYFKPYQHNDHYPAYREWSVPNIIKGEGNHEITPFTVTYHPAANPTLRLPDGAEIKGRTGIPLSYDKGEVFVFFCCWKCTATSEADWNMNIRVYAKRAYLLTNNIAALADEVWNTTPYPSGSGDTRTGYVAVLFVAHGMISFDPNAT